MLQMIQRIVCWDVWMAGRCQPLQLGEGEWQQTQSQEWLASQLVSVLMDYGGLGWLSITLLIVKGFAAPARHWSFDKKLPAI